MGTTKFYPQDSLESIALFSDEKKSIEGDNFYHRKVTD